MAKKTPVVAFIYDFDGTLAPGNMQEYDFIPDIGVPIKDFWKEVKEEAKKHNADQILAYMNLMLKKAREKEIRVQKSNFKKYGKKITFFSGVEGWFTEINNYCEEKGLKPEHYIISSGLREMIEGTAIANRFEEIYASGFAFDQHGVASWPAIAVNYTTKTQFLFRINKGCLGIDDHSVNQIIPENDRRVPFKRMAFFGDGETDVPCMRLVKEKGGLAIGVYNEEKKGAKSSTEKKIGERAHFIFPANYSKENLIDSAIKAWIDKVSAEHKLAVVSKSSKKNTSKEKTPASGEAEEAAKKE